MKRIWLLGTMCAIVLIAGLVFTGCSKDSEGAEDKGKVYELTFAAPHPMEVPMMKEINSAWKNWIEAESDGRIKITFYPAEQLVSAADHYDAARDGIVDIGCQMFMTAPGRFPVSEVVMLPFLFDSPGAMAATMTAQELYDRYPEIQKEYKGVKFLGYHCAALQQVNTVDKPIKTMEDLDGLLVNAAGTYAVGLTKALGATPEMMAPNEKYDALAKGIVVGNIGEWEGQVSWNLYEITNYSTQADLMTFAFVHVMNEDTWNSLPEDLQKLFSDENNLKQSLALSYVFDRDNEKYRKIVEDAYAKRGYPEIYVLPEEERERWKSVAEPVYEQWVENAAKKIGEEKAREILAAARELAEKNNTDHLDQGKAILDEWNSAGE